MFGKQFKDEDTDHEAPVVKTFGDGISASTPDPEPAPEPEPEEQVKPIVGRRMITSEDQKEVKKSFSEMIEKDPEIAISCTSCDMYTYYHLCSKYPKVKSEIRFENRKLDYK